MENAVHDKKIEKKKKKEKKRNRINVRILSNKNTI